MWLCVRENKYFCCKISNTILSAWFLLIAAGLSFGVDAIMALEGTLLLEEIMQAKEVISAGHGLLINLTFVLFLFQEKFACQKNVDPEGDEFRIFKFRMVIW